MEKDLEFIVQEVLKRIKPRSIIHLIDGLNYTSEMMDSLRDEHDIVWISECDVTVLEQNKPIFLPGMSIAQMMSISMGMPIDHCSEICMLMLLRGLDVNIYSSTIQINAYEHLESPLNRKFRDAFQMLIESGLKVHDNRIQIKQEACRDVSSKRLFTEKDIREIIMQGKSELSLDKNTIITPLARDLIRQTKLKIKRM